MTTLKHLWGEHRLALIAFIAALGALAYFSFTTLAAFIYWNDPAHQEQALADWMTPRYVGQSYNLPREVIEDVFFIERGNEPPRMRIGTIAAANDMTLDDLQTRLDAAKAVFEAAREAAQDE